MDEQVIKLAANEETMQEVEDSIDCQDKLEQGGQCFDALYLECQGKEVLSGKDKQGVFEAILDNLTDQGAQKQIEGVGEQFIDRTRILEALLQEADENVREHQLRIIELENALERKSARSISRR